MEFEHAEQWALYQRVRECLEQELGEHSSPMDDAPGFFVEIGEVPLLVDVQAAGPKATITIVGRAPEKADITPEVALLLLRANCGHDVPFGSFGLNDEDTISFSHVVMGEGFDTDSLSLLLHLLSSKLDDVSTRLAEFGD